MYMRPKVVTLLKCDCQQVWSWQVHHHPCLDLRPPPQCLLLFFRLIFLILPEKCHVVSFNIVFILTSLYCPPRPPPPPPAPYWRSCQSWRCQDSPCSTVFQLEKMFYAEYCDYQCINKCILQGSHKLPPKSILLWGLLKCTTSNCNPVHVFLHFGTFGSVVLQLILASKLSELEQFENFSANNQLERKQE